MFVKDQLEMLLGYSVDSVFNDTSLSFDSGYIGQ